VTDKGYSQNPLVAFVHPGLILQRLGEMGGGYAVAAGEGCDGAADQRTGDAFLVLVMVDEEQVQGLSESPK
jgi:hypothetical protein